MENDHSKFVCSSTTLLICSSLGVFASSPSFLMFHCFTLWSLSLFLSLALCLSLCATASQPQLCPRAANTQKHKDLTHFELFVNCYFPQHLLPSAQHCIWLPLGKCFSLCMCVCVCNWLTHTVHICLWWLYQQWRPLGICCQILFDSVRLNITYCSH